MSSKKGKSAPDLAEQRGLLKGYLIFRPGNIIGNIPSLFRCFGIAFSLVQVGTDGFDGHTVILPLLPKTARNQWLSLWGFPDSSKDRKAPWMEWHGHEDHMHAQWPQ